MNKHKFLLDFEKPLRVLEDQLLTLKQTSEEQSVDVTDEIRSIEKKIKETQETIYKNLTPWQKIQLSRHPNRPYSLDYINSIFTDFQELHGDRCFNDDQALIGGTALFDGEPVMILAQQKGRDTKENIKRNFGCPNPEGYRKALRLMRLAEKFNLPLITLIDTSGAYPGIGAEERHVAETIAVNIREMSSLKVPIITVVIGEGGSGGALGIGVADTIAIFENAYYSVISPEGCAAILWKDRAFGPDAARELKISADNLLEFGIVDEVLAEPLGGAHLDHEKAAKTLKKFISKELKKLLGKDLKHLLKERYHKYRAMGVFQETAQAADPANAKALRVI